MTRIPERPLERFCDLYAALLEGRPWWEGRSMLRFCALALTALAGEPRELAARLDALTEELKASTPWYKRSSVGTMLATQLLRHGDGVKDFLAEIERAAPLFRAHWRFSGSTFEALAILILRRHSTDGHVAASQVARLAAIWKELERTHPWLTQRSDWPICALLATRDGTPHAISQRIEALYQTLHGGGCTRGDSLQAAAQVLYFHADEPALVGARFHALYAGFKASGLWMGTHDYDEIALLCFAPHPAAEVLEVALRHREKIRSLTPAPERQTAFTLACGTALLELSRDAAQAELLGEAQLLLNIQSILAAQQAAMIAASSAS
jgi:hypothetical protein